MFRLSSPCRTSLAASLDAQKPLAYVSLIVAFLQQFHLATSLACLTRSPEKSLLHHCVACCAFGVSFQFFSVRLTVSEAEKACESALELFPPLVVVMTPFGAPVMSSCVLSNHLHFICSHPQCHLLQLICSICLCIICSHT